MFLPLLATALVWAANPQIESPSPDMPQRAEPRRADVKPTELEEILQKWEHATAGITRVRANFKGIVYDEVFAVEQHSTGVLSYRDPGRGSYQVSPMAFATGSRSDRKTRDGSSFRYETGSPEHVVWTGTEILLINEPSKSFQRFAIPKRALVNEKIGESTRSSFDFASQLSVPVGSLSPFLRGVRADELQSRFAIEIIRKDDNQIRLAFRPRHDWERESLQQAECILDAKTFEIRAFRTVDSTGQKVRVFVFSDIQTNEAVDRQEDLTAPNLDGYRNLSQPSRAAPE
jgi:TIGR03009 family protein